MGPKNTCDEWDAEVESVKLTWKDDLVKQYMQRLKALTYKMIIITTICLICYLSAVQTLRLTTVLLKTSGSSKYFKRNTVYLNDVYSDFLKAQCSAKSHQLSSISGKLSSGKHCTVFDLLLYCPNYYMIPVIDLDSEDEDFHYVASSYSSSYNVRVLKLSNYSS